MSDQLDYPKGEGDTSTPWDRTSTVPGPDPEKPDEPYTIEPQLPADEQPADGDQILENTTTEAEGRGYR